MRLRFTDWSLRVKMLVLLASASLLPLAAVAILDIGEARRQQLADVESLLHARSDHLVDQLDTFHLAYQRSTKRLARMPQVTDFLAAVSAPEDHLMRGMLEAWVAVDPSIRGVAILDRTGVVRAGTEPVLLGKSLARRRFVREGLGGRDFISDIFLDGPELDDVPTIAYGAPVSVDGEVLGLAVLSVRAEALWAVARASNELAGRGSFAVLFNHQGIRIGHTYSDEMVFHPGGALDAGTIDALVAEGRFGSRTRALLEDVRAFPEQFERARVEAPDTRMFRGFAPVNRRMNYGVARRFKTVPWTVFYMIPEATVTDAQGRLTRHKAALAGGLTALALVIGLLFVARILRPIRALAGATERVGRGDLAARVGPTSGDELGRLGTSFDAMAGRLEAQTTALQLAHDDLEHRVQQRTAELVSSEQRLATTLNSIGDAVIATDTEARVTRMNPVAEQLTGWTLEEAQGRPLAEIFTIVNEESRLPVDNPAARVLREGVVVGLANHTVLIARGGPERPIADSGAPILDGEGGLHGVVLVFRDQTDERRLERERHRAAELERENRRAQEANRLKSEFLANMSHELRTPMNAIIGFADLMHKGKAGALSDEQQEYLGDILISARHLLQLINDILDLAKIESGKMELRPEPVDLVELIAEVRDNLRGLAAGKRIRIDTQVDPATGDVVADPVRIKQILYNYLSNAIKFTSEGGSVIVRVAPEGAELLRIDVEDDGIGVAAEDLGRLFVEFEQLDASAAKKYPGTGLGLALTRRIVEAHGGRVEVKSVLGQGSTFSAVIPRAYGGEGGTATVTDRSRVP